MPIDVFRISEVEFVLYHMKGSLHSQKARDELKESELVHKSIEIKQKGLGNTEFGTSDRILPELQILSKQYQTLVKRYNGLNEIKEFIKKYWVARN